MACQEQSINEINIPTHQGLDEMDEKGINQEMNPPKLTNKPIAGILKETNSGQQQLGHQQSQTPAVIKRKQVEFTKIN